MAMKFSLKKLKKDEDKELNKLYHELDEGNKLYISVHKLEGDNLREFLRWIYLDNLNGKPKWITDAQTKGGWIKYGKMSKIERNKSLESDYQWDPKKSYYENMRKQRKSIHREEVVELVQETDMILMSALSGSLTEKVVKDKVFRKELKKVCKMQELDKPEVLSMSLFDYVDKNNSLDVYPNLVNKRGH